MDVIAGYQILFLIEGNKKRPPRKKRSWYCQDECGLKPLLFSTQVQAGSQWEFV